jgi:large subunit ribosomal protein L33
MAKVAKESAILVSSAGSGYFYINRKNKKKSKGEGKLKLKKYDPYARKHVLFEEKKLSKLKKKFVPGAAIEVVAEAPKAEKSEKAAKSPKPPKVSKKDAAAPEAQG